MKKTFILLLCLLLFSHALADGSLWVDETWIRIDRELDCDGLPLFVHARVLSVPEGTKACRYHLDKLSDDFMIRKGEQIDWADLGCNTDSGTWRLPSREWPEYVFVSDIGMFPCFFLDPAYLLHVANMDPQVYRGHLNIHYVNMESTDELDETVLKQMITDAEKVAIACDYQLGMPLRICTRKDAEALTETLNSLFVTPGNETVEISATNDQPITDDRSFTSLVFPVYYNGLRLYSGDHTESPDSSLQSPGMNLTITVTKQGILDISSVLVDTAKLKAVTDQQSVMTAEEALRCIENRYSSMFLAGCRSVSVHELALEYVPVTADISSGNGLTLYPAWVAQMSSDWVDESLPYELMYYEAYDAISGKPLF